MAERAREGRQLHVGIRDSASDTLLGHFVVFSRLVLFARIASD